MKLLVSAAAAFLVLTVVVTTTGHYFNERQTGVAPPPTIAPPTATIAPPTATTTPSAPGVTTSAPQTTTPSSTAPIAAYSRAEIAAHSSSTSCWLLIDSRVYDVTSYLRRHPGGSRTITPWCGKESTVAFATEDGRGEHSTDAYRQLEDYFIGFLRA